MKFGVYIGPMYPGDMDGTQAFDVQADPAAWPPIWIGADTVESVAHVPEIGDAWIASGRHTRTFIREALPGYRRRLDELGRPFGGVPMFREIRRRRFAASLSAPPRRRWPTSHGRSKRASDGRRNRS
jgi:hypothetical protein